MKTYESSTPKLIATAEHGIGTIAISNVAKRNALDLAMWQAFPSLIATMTADPDVRALVIRGSGDSAFASGADISEFETVRASAAGGRAYEDANEQAFAALAQAPVPVIAMIRRFCMGGGVGIAAACDLRIASTDAVFAVPAGRLGLGYPPRAMRLVVAAFGAPAAKDLFFTARRVAADEAKALGMLHRLVDPDRLEAEAYDLAATIAANAPLALRAAKASIAAASGLPGAVGEDALLALADACFDSADYAEGRRAFLEKRAPAFIGR